MQYLLLIYGDEQATNEQWEQLSEAEQKQSLDEWWTYTKELEDAGVHVAGEALHPTQSAKTVRVRDSEHLVTDGPFAETKEQLGGYYVIDVQTEEEALRWAAKIPSAPYGSVEVRQVMVFTAEVGS
ncbi:MAG: YciI family protein [Gaiellaceae bacterium]